MWPMDYDIEPGCIPRWREEIEELIEQMEVLRCEIAIAESVPLAGPPSPFCGYLTQSCNALEAALRAFKELDLSLEAGADGGGRKGRDASPAPDAVDVPSSNRAVS